MLITLELKVTIDKMFKAYAGEVKEIAFKKDSSNGMYSAAIIDTNNGVFIGASMISSSDALLKANESFTGALVA